MNKKRMARLALACALAGTHIHAQTAVSVIDYKPGTGFFTDFTGVSYTNAQSALGMPAENTPPPFASPITPYNPPYGADQVVSVGQGGSLTLQLGAPAWNHNESFGLDFIIFGNSGFAITNGVFTDEGVTDGTLFNPNNGVTRVSVSADNVTYYELTPSLTPILDNYFPTDASGDFRLAVNPALTGADFEGKDLAGIRALYNGSAGGTGFDLSWARDSQGQNPNLSFLQYVRVDVLSGSAEIDALVITSVPEPGVVALAFGGIAMIALARSRMKRG